MINNEDISSSKYIVVDIETYDPFLNTTAANPLGMKNSSGYLRPESQLMGVGVKAQGFEAYINCGHSGSEQIKPEDIVFWLNTNLRSFKGYLVGANIKYDLLWLTRFGLVIPKHIKVWDVLVAQKLIDENNSWNLDATSKFYGFSGKDNAYLIDTYGAHWIRDIRKIPYIDIKPYVLSDIRNPIDIARKQYAQLSKERLLDIYTVEMDVLKYLVEIEFRGVKVDIEQADRVDNELDLKYNRLLSELEKFTGRPLKLTIKQDKACIFDKLGIPYGLTDKSKEPKIDKPLINKHSDIREIDWLKQCLYINTLRSTFLKAINIGHINGRLHTSFNQARPNTGRFSSSGPNLQNIPKRDKVYGPLLRSMFCADSDSIWLSGDWSQMEYRILVHLANSPSYVPIVLNSARKVLNEFITDPDTDYHSMAAKLTSLERSHAKNINFGIIFGMGAKKLAQSLGRGSEEANAILKKYHSMLPFVNQIKSTSTNKAVAAGHIRSLGGRLRHFNKWCPSWNGVPYRGPLLSHEDAIEKYTSGEEGWKSGIQRAQTQNALNFLTQGSCADAMKITMAAIYNSGLNDDFKLSLTVHDELNGSIVKSNKTEEIIKEVINIMETSFKLSLPTRVDYGVGSNWAEAKA